jgi:hypothetical protein
MPAPRTAAFLRKATALALITGATLVALGGAELASAAPPPAPTGLHIVSVTQATATIAWDRSGYPNFMVSKGASDLATIPDTTYTYTGLGCNVRFNASVAGITSAGQRSSSATISVRTAVCGPTPPPPVAPASTAVPTLSGEAAVNGTLNASTGSWSGTTPLTYAYAWERCNAAGAGCASVPAVAASYAVTFMDVGSRLRVRVTATNAAGSASAYSALTDVVADSTPPPPPPPPGGPTCTGTDITYRSSASSAEIVFDLGGNVYSCGQFANGDWFVVGPAVIRQITPAIIGSGASLRHGVDVNPSVTSGNSQRWEGRLAGVQPTLVGFPYTAQPGQSIVKYVSNSPGAPCPEKRCGRFAAVLTVLASAPASPETTFRPPYWGSYKPLISTNDLDTSLLSQLSSSSAPAKISRAEVLARTRHLRLDTSPSSVAGGGGLEPVDAFYEGNAWGTNVLRADTEVALWLLLDNACTAPPCSAEADLAAKMPVLIGFVQNGLDLWAGTRAGLNLNRGGGGNGAGKLFLEVFAATLLRSSPMSVEIAAANDRLFWETFSLYRGANGTALWGQMWPNSDRAAWESSYWQNLDACSNCSTRDPYGLIDGGARPGTGYQRSTMLPTKYMALVLRRIPAMADYWPDLHEEVVMEYADRVVSSGVLTLPDECAPKGSTYGVDYGPDGQGGCIKGSGRVPAYHGTTVDGAGPGQRRSVFGDQMWVAYR